MPASQAQMKAAIDPIVCSRLTAAQVQQRQQHHEVSSSKFDTIVQHDEVALFRQPIDVAVFPENTFSPTQLFRSLNRAFGRKKPGTARYCQPSVLPMNRQPGDQHGDHERY